MASPTVIIDQGNFEQYMDFITYNRLSAKTVRFEGISAYVDEMDHILQMIDGVEEYQFIHMEVYEDDSSWEGVKEEDNRKLLFAKLHKLTIDACEEGELLLSMLKGCTSLENISINTDHWNSVDTAWELIRYQPFLEVMELTVDHSKFSSGTVFTDIFGYIGYVNDIRLKTLKLDCHAEIDHGFNKFIERNSSLKELHLRQPISLHQLWLIVKCRTNLKKLSIVPFHECHEKDGTIKKLMQVKNESLTELELHPKSEDDSERTSNFSMIVDLFPNVEVMTINYEQVCLHDVLRKLPKLRKLVCQPFRTENLCFAKSLSMKEIEMSDVSPLVIDNCLELFAKNCPNVERIVIADLYVKRLAKSIDADVRNLLKGLLHFNNLKYFKIINKISKYWDVSSDESRREPRQSMASRKFILVLRTKAQKLSISNYFQTVHANAVQDIVDKFTITSIENV